MPQPLRVQIDQSVQSGRFELRKTLERILGRKYRPLVTRASWSTKRDFIRFRTPDHLRVIKHRLGLDPGRFWRVAEGNECLDLRSLSRQLTSFRRRPVTDIPKAA